MGEQAVPDTQLFPAIIQPAFLFVVDLAIPENGLEAINASIEQTLTLLPSECLVGLITFGKHCSVHGYVHCNKSIVFRGDIHVAS